MPLIIRRATSADLEVLPEIEAAGDQMFVRAWGLDGWEPPHPGAERLERSGFVLVAVLADDASDPVGFAHVVESPDGAHAHLEQMTVRPEVGGQGIGTALLEAVETETARRGHRELTLCTFAHVPWNGPVYRRRGFVETPVPDVEFYREIVADEAWLEQYDERVFMRIPLGSEPAMTTSAARKRARS